MFPAFPAILVLAAAAALAGCTSPATRIRANAQLFNSIPPASQELIKQGQIALGFTPDMVLLALGKPDVVAQHVDANGSTEVWRYQSFENSTSTVVYAGYPVYASYGYGGWWGGPMYSPMRGWNVWGAPAIGWSATATPTDYLSVSFRDGHVTEINRTR